MPFKLSLFHGLLEAAEHLTYIPAEAQSARDTGRVERAEYDMYQRWYDSHKRLRGSMDDEDISPELAAEILVSLKFAKVEVPEETVMSDAANLKRVQPSSNGFSAGIHLVTLKHLLWQSSHYFTLSLS